LHKPSAYEDGLSELHELSLMKCQHSAQYILQYILQYTFHLRGPCFFTAEILPLVMAVFGRPD